MMNILGRSPRLASVVAVAAVALAAGGGGWAFAAGGGASTIRACASKKTGALRVARKCGRRERKLSWAITGPAGPKGAMGPMGAQGAQGPGAAALHFSDQATAAPPGMVIGRIGGFTFSEQCQIQGTGAMQATVSVQNPASWHAFETSSAQLLSAQTTATTTLSSASASDGSLRTVTTALAPPTKSGQVSLDVELLNQVTNQVIDVHMGVLVDATSNLCAGIGAAVPAS